MTLPLAPVRSPILARLKAETAVWHDALERRVDIDGRLGSVPAYRSLLGRFLGFYEPVEALLRSVEGERGLPILLDGRWKTGRLISDLRALGSSADAITALPRCADLPSLITAAQAFGCLYVLEGATLGGQLISRHVRRRFGLGPAGGVAFFAGYGDRVGPMWRAFGAVLTDFSTRHACDDEIVRAAIDTFAAFEHWIAAGVPAARESL